MIEVNAIKPSGGAGRSHLSLPAAETYLFIGALNFVLAFSFARFADFLERRTKTGH